MTEPDDAVPEADPAMPAEAEATVEVMPESASAEPVVTPSKPVVQPAEPDGSAADSVAPKPEVPADAPEASEPAVPAAGSVASEPGAPETVAAAPSVSAGAPEAEASSPQAESHTQTEAQTDPEVSVPAAAQPSAPKAPDAESQAPDAESQAPDAEPAVAESVAGVPRPSVGDSAPAGGPASSGPPPPPGGKRPSAPKPKTTDAGKIVSGIVTAIDTDELSLTLEDGRLAVLARRHWDLQPIEDLHAVVSLHDRVDAAILARDDPKGRVVLSRSWAIKKHAWDVVEAAAADHSTVKARVTSLSGKGIVVDVGGLRGFVPASHLALEPLDDFSEFADQTLELRVLESDARKERLVLSRRSILLREQRKGTHERLTSLEVGSTITGTVASLADYGAFIELGGVKGLVHLSELSWHRVGHPRDVLSVGDTVEVKVLDVKVKKRRVSLSMRQVAPDPFGQVTPGSVVSGPVTRLVDFGAFVDLGGVEGLVHLSELAEYRVSAPEEIVTPGEEVMVKVLSVDRRRRRIELSIRQAVSDQYGR